MSVTIKHTPQRYSEYSVNENYYLISGDDLEELITECLNRIRPKSKEFYKDELRKDLQEEGESLIDVHAGCGTCYKVLYTAYRVSK